MTTTTQRLHFDMHPRQREKPDWRAAFRALRALLADPDHTDLAYQIFDALDPDVHERTLARMLEHPVGRRVFAEKPVLLDRLADRAFLERLPEGSLGRAYLEHLDRHGLDPEKLVQLDRAHRNRPELDPDLRWMGERSALQHDLWHVLTGYGADEPGESALLAFSAAQAGGRANLLLAVGANLNVSRERGLRWLGHAFLAWRRGRRALCLTALPYESLLPLPLDEVRRAVGLAAPEADPPGGIRRGRASTTPTISVDV